MTTELCGWLQHLRCICMRARLVEADADTVWKRQNDSAKRNVAYQLLNLSGSGELQKVYREKGADGLREHIRWVLPKYLYFDGKKAGVITVMEFARYRHRLSKKAHSMLCSICLRDDEWYNVTVCDECGVNVHIYCLNPILSKVPEDLWYCDECKEDEENIKDVNETLHATLESDDSLSDVRDHPACWNLKMRGVCGETPLHMCYLSSTEDDKNIARIMLEEFPYLAQDLYEGTTFFGETALHFAIIKKQMDSVRTLVKHDIRLDARARGTFFLPLDIQNGTKTRQKTNYKGHANYGEYPLAFAASTGQVEVYDYLITQSELHPNLGMVDPNAQDSFGNTVLHMCVIYNQKSMYHHALKHHLMPASQTIKNNVGLTPMALACKLGHSDMFQVILDLSSHPFWSYGNISCMACPLELLDTIGPNGEKNEGAALAIITKGRSDGHAEILENSVVARILDEKWKRYIKKRFTFKFIWAFVHLITLFLATQLRPAKQEDLLGPTDPKSIVRYTLEAGVVFGCTAKFVVEALEMKLLKPKRYFQNLLQVPARLIFIVACILIYVCVIFRFTGRYSWEEMTLIVAIPCSWTYLFFFYRGTESLGPYVVMIGKMLTGDVLQFWVIMSTVLVFFATVFYYLFLDGSLGDEEATNEGFSLPSRAFISLFGMTFGNFNYVEFYNSRINWLATILFIMFMVLSPILLLNMLIAMMAKTYEDVIEKSKVEWKRQWARIILVMEGAVSKEQLLYHQSKYSVEVPSSTWSNQKTVMAAKRHREKIRRDATLHHSVINPAYEPDNFDNDITRTNSMENLIPEKKNSLQKQAWEPNLVNLVEEEQPKTRRALLIMKSMEKSKAKSKKKTKFNWNIVREIVSDTGGKDSLSAQGSSGEKSKQLSHRPAAMLAFRAMASVLKGTSDNLTI